jgi:transcriptional regulator with XRE-family HTH domain
VKIGNPASVEAARLFRGYFAKSAKEYRQKNKLSVIQLAAMVNLSAKKITRIECETYEVNTTELVKLANAMGFPASQLLVAGGL